MLGTKSVLHLQAPRLLHSEFGVVHSFPVDVQPKPTVPSAEGSKQSKKLRSKLTIVFNKYFIVNCEVDSGAIRTLASELRACWFDALLAQKTVQVECLAGLVPDSSDG